MNIKVAPFTVREKSSNILCPKLDHIYSKGIFTMSHLNMMFFIDFTIDVKLSQFVITFRIEWDSDLEYIGNFGVL